MLDKICNQLSDEKFRSTLINPNKGLHQIFQNN